MQSNQLLHPQLEEIKVQLDAASRQAESLVNGVPFELLNERPQPDEWSIAECIAHLNLSSEAEINVLNDAYERFPTRLMNVDRQFKMDLLGRFLKWTLEPPPMSLSKIKTTKGFQPASVESLGEVLPKFLALQEQLKTCAEAANGLPLDLIKVVSPFNTKVKIQPAFVFPHIVSARAASSLAG